jgi:hypothetical protein
MLVQICTNTNSEEGPHENNSFTYISIPDGTTLFWKEPKLLWI